MIFDFGYAILVSSKERSSCSGSSFSFGSSKVKETRLHSKGDTKKPKALYFKGFGIMSELFKSFFLHQNPDENSSRFLFCSFLY